ncbi:MAG: hypothetical protein ACTSQF_05045 [Candidatus Heimdallarchaeaceae archaeon]
MSRFSGSKKRKNKYITSAEEYYKDHYGGEKAEVETLSIDEEALVQKLTSVGAIRVRKASTYRNQYEFDLPAEHEDDVYHKISLAVESNQDVTIDAELIEEFPLFLHAMVKQESKGKVFDSFEGMSVSNFLTLRTNNKKLAYKILDNPDVSMVYMSLLSNVKILSINNNTLSAILDGLDKLDEFFQLMTQIVKVSI